MTLSGRQRPSQDGHDSRIGVDGTGLCLYCGEDSSTVVVGGPIWGISVEKDHAISTRTELRYLRG